MKRALVVSMLLVLATPAAAQDAACRYARRHGLQVAAQYHGEAMTAAGVPDALLQVALDAMGEAYTNELRRRGLPRVSDGPAALAVVTMRPGASARFGAPDLIVDVVLSLHGVPGATETRITLFASASSAASDASASYAEQGADLGHRIGAAMAALACLPARVESSSRR